MKTLIISIYETILIIISNGKMLRKQSTRKAKQNKTKQNPFNKQIKKKRKTKCHYNYFLIYSMPLLFLFLVRNIAIKTGK
jgi:hypothetical protein